MNNLMKTVIVLLLLLIGANSSLYVVSEFERGVKLQFGKLVEADIQPGLHVKIPFVEPKK